MLNAITVDVEYWYQSFKNENIFSPSWEENNSSIIENVAKILRLFNDSNVKATFFILGTVAERYPEVVRMISEQCHEVATHGYSHELVYNMNPEGFSEELRRSIAIIEGLSGQKILGHRAPAWSITEKSKWALDIVFEQGLLYDSSISPFVTYVYGMRGFNKKPHIIKKEGDKVLYEFPLSTISILNKDLPVAGGFFTRLYPYWFIKHAFQKINKDGSPVTFYFHTWDLDVDQPRLKLPLKMKRHYYNLKTTEKKIRRLLSDFKFAPIKEIIKAGWDD